MGTRLTTLPPTEQRGTQYQAQRREEPGGRGRGSSGRRAGSARGQLQARLPLGADCPSQRRQAEIFPLSQLRRIWAEGERSPFSTLHTHTYSQPYPLTAHIPTRTHLHHTHTEYIHTHTHRGQTSHTPHTNPTHASYTNSQTHTSPLHIQTHIPQTNCMSHIPHTNTQPYTQLTHKLTDLQIHRHAHKYTHSHHTLHIYKHKTPANHDTHTHTSSVQSVMSDSWLPWPSPTPRTYSNSCPLSR